jgi:hypothetical protein
MPAATIKSECVERDFLPKNLDHQLILHLDHIAVVARLQETSEAARNVDA